jgi:murein DD-endopeptidase MepM/ murein hydrolase activator NlpD
MPRLTVLACPRVALRAAAVAFLALGAAGCADSGRFSTVGQPPQDVTSSLATRPMYRAVDSQPLPAPARPDTVSPAGVYVQRTPVHEARVTRSDIEDIGTSGGRKSNGEWSWRGGSTITAGPNDTIDSISRRYGVPAAAIMQTNGLRRATDLRRGQHLVIPRHVGAQSSRVAARHPATPQSAPASAARGNLYLVKSGETLISIARRHGLSMAELAHASHISPFTKVNVGDRLTIPAGSQHLAKVQTPSTQAEKEPSRHRTQSQSVTTQQRVASAATQSVRVATQEPTTTQSVVQKAEPVSSAPSFRWPVRGRIIAGFGSKPNGTQNDGINLAVPEGTPVKAAENGTVAYAGNELKGYGNLVLIRHSNGFVSAYANASELLVKRGDTVRRGQVIAHAGQTGNVSSPQLHFEIRKGSTPVDPTKYLGGA